MQLRREAELTIWHQFSRALARSHWRDMDVILLEKNVQMDANIRAAQIELDAMGMMIKNKRGAPITNPFLLVIDTLERSAAYHPFNVVKSNGLCSTHGEWHGQGRWRG